MTISIKETLIISAVVLTDLFPPSVVVALSVAPLRFFASPCYAKKSLVNTLTLRLTSFLRVYAIP